MSNLDCSCLPREMTKIVLEFYTEPCLVLTQYVRGYHGRHNEVFIWIIRDKCPLKIEDVSCFRFDDLNTAQFTETRLFVSGEVQVFRNGQETGTHQAELASAHKLFARLITPKDPPTLKYHRITPSLDGSFFPDARISCVLNTRFLRKAPVLKR